MIPRTTGRTCTIQLVNTTTDVALIRTPCIWSRFSTRSSTPSINSLTDGMDPTTPSCLLKATAPAMDSMATSSMAGTIRRYRKLSTLAPTTVALWKIATFSTTTFSVPTISRPAASLPRSMRRSPASSTSFQAGTRTPGDTTAMMVARSRPRRRGTLTARRSEVIQTPAALSLTHRNVLIHHFAHRWGYRRRRHRFQPESRLLHQEREPDR